MKNDELKEVLDLSVDLQMYSVQDADNSEFARGFESGIHYAGKLLSKILLELGIEDVEE